MPRMIDLIRNSQVPSNLMQAAAHGALPVPPGEMIEILVHLALHNKVFAEPAQHTLAGWDEKALLAAAADPRTSAEVLGYLIAPRHLRPQLLPALAENPSVAPEKLIELAVSGSREVVEALLASERAKSSPPILDALRFNPSLHPEERAEIETRLAPLGLTHPPAEVAAEEASDSADEEVLAHYLEENEAELAAAANQPFQPIGMVLAGPGAESAAGVQSPAVAESAGAETGGAGHDPGKPAAAATTAAKPVKKAVPAHEEKRDSTLQKIAKLDIKGRIHLAVRGSKEDRSILVRDSTKLVALAVLESPKVSDGEVEGFATQRNVLDSVLRAIPMKRRFAKNYAIMRNLVHNPRTPLDVSLGLMKNMLIQDLKNLSGNKEVSDTIRKLAMRMFKQKMDKKD
jgi:hypothetical protein